MNSRPVKKFKPIYYILSVLGAATLAVLTVKSADTSAINIASALTDDSEAGNLFVAKNGESDNLGTINNPLSSIKDACKLIENGSNVKNIYLRAGTYTNPNYDTGNKNNKSMPAITCSGSPEQYLTIKPYKDERVIFAFDSFNGVRLKGNYLNFMGFEVKGAAQNVTYEEALADWWIGSNIYNGNGIVINGHHVNVKNNIVHDTTGSAIFINNGGDYSNITDNIIYNAAWWSTKGTTAIGLINARTSNNASEGSIKVVRNLIFASESRIFSRVPSKGFAELAIDEGSGTLVQVNAENYRGGYLIKDNFYLYNGKGIAIARTNDVVVKNNTLYLNGSTINGKSTGLRLNEGCDIRFIQNAVVVASEDRAYSDANKYDNCNSNNSPAQTKNNYFVGGDPTANLPADNSLVAKIFTDPDNLDFSLVTGIPDNVGAPLKVFKNLKTKVEQHGKKIEPSNWKMDYEAQTKAIVESAPQGSIYDWSEWPKKVEVNLPSGQKFGGHERFELRIKTPYARDPE